MISFAELAEQWRPVRERVEAFVEGSVYPLERELDDVDNDRYFALMRPLMAEAKKRGIWALGHPREIGGQGMPFAAYVLINEVIGRSEHAIVALGTHTLQDSLMLQQFAATSWKERYLGPLVQGEFFPSVSMTEPAVASSDPTSSRPRPPWRVANGEYQAASGSPRGPTGPRSRPCSPVPNRKQRPPTVRFR